jgi:hypothetical protein
VTKQPKKDEGQRPDRKQQAEGPEADEKLLEDLDTDENVDVKGGRRAGQRLSP